MELPLLSDLLDSAELHPCRCEVLATGLANSRLIHLPTEARPLPTPGDLDRLMRCPYAVIVVAGRSGSSLIHSYLDGHRQVAQFPQIVKFHDYLAATPANGTAAALARAFVVFSAHAPLFDTRRSIHVGGQLGVNGEIAITIDERSFVAAMTAALGDRTIDPRCAFYAAVLAYEWCLGRDLGEARVVLHHLHHGDWLWPDLLIDRYNLGGFQPSEAACASLKPDLLLVSLRAPRDILRSYPALTAAVTANGAERVQYYERLVRLLVQDWLRVRVAAAGNVATVGIRLEDIKSDRRGTFARLCALLGIDAGDPALDSTSYYGQAWTEDTWTAARNSLAPMPGLDSDVAWQDEAFVMGALAGLTDGIYATDPRFVDWNTVLALLMQAAQDPPATLFPGLRATPDGAAAAADLVWDRIGFLERFRSLVESHPLGQPLLCRNDDADKALSLKSA